GCEAARPSGFPPLQGLAGPNRGGTTEVPDLRGSYAGTMMLQQVSPGSGTSRHGAGTAASCAIARKVRERVSGTSGTGNLPRPPVLTLCATSGLTQCSKVECAGGQILRSASPWRSWQESLLTLCSTPPRADAVAPARRGQTVIGCSVRSIW